MSIQVQYGKLNYTIMNDGNAIELMHVMHQLNNLTNITIEHQKLYMKGKQLREQSMIIPFGSKLLLVGTPMSSITKLNEQEASAQKEWTIRNSRKTTSIAKRNEEYKAPHAEYSFQQIKVLDNMEGQEVALEFLESLANDVGILAVMEKHKWKVGRLEEMYPEGKVGIDPVCVLGLNENHGQVIYLRLRTDDLEGFRGYASVKECLFHELTHNQISEHNDEFYKLFREIQREADALDWTKRGGRVLGYRRFDAHGIFRNPNTQQILPKEVESSTSSSIKLADDAPSCVPVEGSVSHEESNVAMVESSALPLEKNIDKSNIVSQEKSTDDVEKRSENALHHEQFYPIDSRQQQLFRSIQALKKNTTLLEFQKAINMMNTIITNIMQYEMEEKYRRLRRSNKSIYWLEQLTGSLAFLKSAGFEQENDHLTYHRNDPGLLWLAKSILESTSAH